MRKKHKIYQSPTVRIEPLPKAFVTSVSVSNMQEQKAQFLKHGKTPIFVVEGDTSTVEELAAKSSGKIRFDLLGEAEYIINTVKQKYGKGENYLEHIYGPRIDQNEANEILFDYIRENSLQESLSVYWSNDMPCSARMVWKGYSFKCNRPEARRYALWLNGTHENPYLRRHGLRCLMDHEIGTHFYRSYNDGFQPWFYDRKKFGLRGTGSFESLCTEEGFAAVNTTLRAKEKYLWLSALTYYTACKSTEMTFKQLFDHLGQFLDNPEQRWKHVMRVKRGLLDPNDLGGYGKDQCYFEGAVLILRNIDKINFHLLMSGKICYDEVDRVKRLARLGSICLPAIMKDMDAYRRQLKKMAAINGLHLAHPAHEPSCAYMQRLKERQTGVRRRRKVRKVKKASRSSSSKVSGSQSNQSQTSCSEPSGGQPMESNKAPTSEDGPHQTQLNSIAQEPAFDVKGACSSFSGTLGSDYITALTDCNSQSTHQGHCDDSLTPTGVSGLKVGQDRKDSVPACRKTRPHTAGESYAHRLPPLHPSHGPEKLKPANSQTSVFCLRAEDSDSSSFAGLFSVCGDYSSGDDLSQCAEDDMESWLINMPPPSSSSSPSPSPRAAQHLQLTFASSPSCPPPCPPCPCPPHPPSRQCSLPPISQDEKHSVQQASSADINGNVGRSTQDRALTSSKSSPLQDGLTNVTLSTQDGGLSSSVGLSRLDSLASGSQLRKAGRPRSSHSKRTALPRQS